MRQEVLGHMRGCSVFRGFSESELDLLSTAFEVKRLDPGQILCREGDPAPSFYIIVSGIVWVTKEINQKLRRRLATIGKNCLIGQVSLIDGGRRTATMEAGAPTVLLECNRKDFELLYQANSPFAYKMLDFVIVDVSKRLREANLRLEELLSDPGRTLSSLYEAFVEVGKAVHQTDEYRIGFVR